MAPIEIATRYNVALFLACLVCFGIIIPPTEAFTNSNGGGARATTTSSFLRKPIHQQSLPSGSKVPFPLEHRSDHFGIIICAASNSDGSLQDASLVGKSDESSNKLAVRWWKKKNPWKLVLLRTLSRVCKNGMLRMRLQKQTLILSFIISTMSFRMPQPAHAVAASAEETNAISKVQQLDNCNPDKSSNNIGKASATAVMVASGVNVFRLNRNKRRQDEDATAFESWNASWNSTTSTSEPPNGNPVAATTSSSYYMPTMEMYRFVQTDAPTNATTTNWNHNNNDYDNNSGFVDSQDVPKDNVMKATVEAMKRAGGESTELVQQQCHQQGDKEPSSLEQEEEESTKYPKERMPILDPVEQAKVQAKYAAIESLEDRAFQILLDLGMIEKTGED